MDLKLLFTVRRWKDESVSPVRSLKTVDLLRSKLIVSKREPTGNRFVSSSSNFAKTRSEIKALAFFHSVLRIRSTTCRSSNEFQVFGCS